MATFISTNQTTTHILAAEDDLFLLAGVSLTSNGNGIQTASGNNGGHTLAIYGSIAAAANGIALTRTGNTLPFINNVSIGTTGTVLSLNDDGLVSNSDFFRLANAGTIATMGGSSSDHGLDLFANAEIVNSGTISSLNGDGIRLAPTAFIDSTGPQYLNNSGLISGGENGVTYSGMWLTGVNSGEISGVGGGIAVLGSLGLMTFTNTGLIQATLGPAVQSSVGDDVLRNSGTIVGDVHLGDGADNYVGKAGGTVFGFVYGGEGNDTLSGSDSDDDLAGDDGDDQISGRIGDDYLTGGKGVDTMIGGAHDDSLYGGDWDDVLGGGSGEDVLFGENGNDVLRGGADDDVLNGGSGDDILRGGAGSDTLLGSLGTDWMAGAEGADIFVWERPGDSRMGALRDVVEDFVSGEDILDLAAAVPGTLAYLGSGAFTGGSAQVRHFVSGTSTIVEVDRTGSGSADFQIELLNASGLTADDFVF